MTVLSSVTETYRAFRTYAPPFLSLFIYITQEITLSNVAKKKKFLGSQRQATSTYNQNLEFIMLPPFLYFVSIIPKDRSLTITWQAFYIDPVLITI